MGVKRKLPLHLRPVIALDLDGTLGQYHRHFLHFAEDWLGRELRPAHYYEVTEPFASFIGVSKATYRRIKLAYRQGGMKRSMPPYVGADDLARSLRSQGALVVICTTRPYLHLSNIEPDTREWLRRNKVQYDAIFYGEHKYRDLRTEFGKERIVAVLDDLPEMWRQAEACGLPVIARGNPHNAEVIETEGRIEASNLQRAKAMLEDRLNLWFEENNSNG